MKTGVPANRELVEIRVSTDAVIEVFATGRSGMPERDEFGLRDDIYLSPWEESFAERSELQRTLKQFRRARQLKCFVAYGAFATCAAIVIWYAVG